MVNSGLIILGIAGAAVVGGYFIIPKLSRTDPTPRPIQTNNPMTVPPENKDSQTTTVYEQELIVTPDIIHQVLTILPDLEGGQVINFIHGGNIEDLYCGYKGTNHKCYDSEYDAWSNGAVPNYNPHNRLATKP